MLAALRGVQTMGNRERTNNLIKQIWKFGLVGGISSFIDYAVLAFCVEALKFHYLFSGLISFTISVVVSYSLSMRYVFHTRSNHDKRQEFVLFVLLSSFGLVINEVVMVACIEIADMHYLVAKVLATTAAMAYNFISKKILFENKARTRMERKDIGK